MQMLIMGLFAVMVLVFALALYVSNVRDVLYTSREAAKGRRPHSFRQSLAAAADGKFYVSALVLPIVGVAMFSVLPIVFMILMAFTDFGGEVVHPVLASWSLLGLAEDTRASARWAAPSARYWSGTSSGPWSPPP